jgi:hypothetical protein
MLAPRLANAQLAPSGGALGKPFEEFIETSYPSMKAEEWKQGTPGNTFSILACVELIVTYAQLKEPEVLGDTIALWKAAKFAFPGLLEHEELLARVFKNFGSAIEFLRTTDVERYHLESLVDLTIELILELPLQRISRYIEVEGSLTKAITDIALFRTDVSEKLLPYLEALDPGAIGDYNYA